VQLRTLLAQDAAPAGVQVPLSAIDNPLLDGLETVAISASATGYSAGGGNVKVHDDETATLTVSLPQEQAAVRDMVVFPPRNRPAIWS